ncbi:hypothetical protein QKU48_gp1344 [Fadolivirus algeromassiliense]|jgi:hypothetical protein|uniref:Uncharacterized protein n=1 Tax=Fadolivirus FV1/VV64 TaxID=3070911 RepID=A0A7D3R1U7_9VIRU|nr:hypothetical protein QKU48_gp1344 [Fadolivirus algeromassiliense]QKF94802.1 hypothetical protein Fadolivirus_1_1344 [Fadolivirus FV1/VV64]
MEIDVSKLTDTQLDVLIKQIEKELYKRGIECYGILTKNKNDDDAPISFAKELYKILFNIELFKGGWPNQLRFDKVMVRFVKLVNQYNVPLIVKSSSLPSYPIRLDTDLIKLKQGEQPVVLEYNVFETHFGDITSAEKFEVRKGSFEVPKFCVLSNKAVNTLFDRLELFLKHYVIHGLFEYNYKEKKNIFWSDSDLHNFLIGLINISDDLYKEQYNLYIEDDSNGFSRSQEEWEAWINLIIQLGEYHESGKL